MQTTREITRSSQNQRERDIFMCPAPSPGTAPLQAIPHLRAQRAGFVPGVARGGGRGQIKPCMH